MMEKHYFTPKTKTLILMVSFTIIMIVGFILFQYQVKQLKDNFEFNVVNIIKRDINNKIIDIKTILTSLSKFNQSNQEMTSSSFSIFTQDLLKQSPYINNILYSSIVLEKDKIDFETYMQDIGYYNFYIKSFDQKSKNFIKAPIHKQYLPIVLLEPSTYKFTQYLGYDIFNNNYLQESFHKAIKTAKVVNNNSKLFHGKDSWFLIKATYFGETVPTLVVDRIKDIKGFYIINVDIDKMLKEYNELYSDYTVQIISISNIDALTNNIKHEDFDTIENISSLIKLEESPQQIFICNERDTSS